MSGDCEKKDLEDRVKERNWDRPHFREFGSVFIDGPEYLIVEHEEGDPKELCSYYGIYFKDKEAVVLNNIICERDEFGDFSFNGPHYWIKGKTRFWDKELLEAVKERRGKLELFDKEGSCYKNKKSVIQNMLFCIHEFGKGTKYYEGFRRAPYYDILGTISSDGKGYFLIVQPKKGSELMLCSNRGELIKYEGEKTLNQLNLVRVLMAYKEKIKQRNTNILDFVKKEEKLKKIQEERKKRFNRIIIPLIESQKLTEADEKYCYYQEENIDAYVELLTQEGKKRGSLYLEYIEMLLPYNIPDNKFDLILDKVKENGIKITIDEHIKVPSLDDMIEKERREQEHTTTFEAIKKYFTLVGEALLFDPEEENKLIREMVNGDPIAAQRLIRSKLRLVVSVARKYQNRGLLFPQLLEAGNKGFYEAIGEYKTQNISLDCNLTHFIILKIREEIVKALRNRNETIKEADEIILKRSYYFFFERYLNSKYTKKINEDGKIYDKSEEEIKSEVKRVIHKKEINLKHANILLLEGRCENLDEIIECSIRKIPQQYSIIRRIKRKGGWSNGFEVIERDETGEEFRRFLKEASKNVAGSKGEQKKLGSLKEMILREGAILKKLLYNRSSLDYGEYFGYIPIPILWDYIDISIKEEQGIKKKKGLIYEFIDGKDLGEIIEENPEGLREDLDHKFINIALKAAYALNFVHKNFGTHNDVKPDNFMVSSNGKFVYILDLAFSRTYAYKGSLKASRHYTAPERMKPKTSPTEQSDIYAFGIMLYELVTGKKPYTIKGTKKEKEEMVDKIFLGEIKPSYEPIEEIINETKDGRIKTLLDVIKKCLEYDPNKRYKTMKEVENILVNLSNTDFCKKGSLLCYGKP